jgi:hypothetical protein
MQYKKLNSSKNHSAKFVLAKMATALVIVIALAYILFLIYLIVKAYN